MAELDIWMGGKPVGVLDGSDRRALEITYDERWLADPQATPLSVSLPLGEERHRGERVAAHLWGLLPDNEQVISVGRAPTSAPLRTSSGCWWVLAPTSPVRRSTCPEASLPTTLRLARWSR